MYKILFTIGVVLCSATAVFSEEKETGMLDNLVRRFEQNPADRQVTVQLLKELDKQGKSGQEVVNSYFKTQKEDDYFKEYNWVIVRDYVHDFEAPQIRYVFDNKDKFMQRYSKDDVFQKLDNVLVNHLEKYYNQNSEDYNIQLQKIKDAGYEHYDVVYDYFNIKELRVRKDAENYFYKARKLFRYFPENRKMIKEITAGALEIMDDVPRLKVIQLWAGKTVESKKDFDAICNYALISDKCGFKDVAKKYTDLAQHLATTANDQFMKQRINELLKKVK